MELAYGSPAHLGLVIPHDPVTGAVVPAAAWAADAVLAVSAPRVYEGAYHAVQTGEEGTIDVVLRRPRDLSITYQLTDAWTAETLIRHPLRALAGPARAVRMLRALEKIQEAGQPVTVIVRPYGVLTPYLLLGVSPDAPLETREIRVVATFRHYRPESLSLAEPVQDEDVAAVSQIVTLGVLA